MSRDFTVLAVVVAGALAAWSVAPAREVCAYDARRGLAPAAWDRSDADDPRDFHLSLQAALEVSDGDLMGALRTARDAGWRFVYDPRRTMLKGER